MWAATSWRVSSCHWWTQASGSTSRSPQEFRFLGLVRISNLPDIPVAQAHPGSRLYGAAGPGGDTPFLQRPRGQIPSGALKAVPDFVRRPLPVSLSREVLMDQRWGPDPPPGLRGASVNALPRPGGSLRGSQRLGRRTGRVLLGRMDGSRRPPEDAAPFQCGGTLSPPHLSEGLLSCYLEEVKIFS